MSTTSSLEQLYGQPYFNEYYDHLSLENQEAGCFLMEATADLRGDGQPLRGLDVGCGPTMLYWSPFLCDLDEYHGMDGLAGNIETVLKERDHCLGGDIHPRYREVCDFRDRHVGAVMPGRIERICARVRTVVQADMTSRWPFADAAMSLVTMIFCLEVLPDVDAVRRTLAEARRVLRAAGRLVIVTTADAEKWRIADYEVACQALKPELVAELLLAAGFTDIRSERRPACTAMERQQGYSWLLFARGDVPT